MIDEDEIALLLKTPVRKNGFTWPPHPIQVISYLYITLTPTSIITLLLIHIPSSAIAILAAVIFVLLWSGSVVFGVWTAALDPAKDVECIDSHDTTAVYCHICKKTVYQDALHCKYCNKCVRELDHHCFYLDTCIAKPNYRLFVCALVWVWGLSAAVIVGFGVAYLATDIPSLFHSYFSATSTYLWHYLSLVQCILSFVVLVFMTYLLLIHAVLYCYSITTLEYSRAKRQGRLRFFFFYKKPQVSPTLDTP